MSEIPKKQPRRVEESHVHDRQLSVSSEKKLRANRENAKKSTGPKSPRGKSQSRRNAIKHGLFARTDLNFFLQGEDSEEYHGLLKDLWEQYKPVGRAEELEVERITLCWWRLKRAHQYENASKRVVLRDVTPGGFARQAESCEKLEKEDASFTLALRKLKEEIAAADEAPPDLRDRLIALRPAFRPLWPFIESGATQFLELPHVAKLVKEATPEELPVGLALATIEVAISFVKHMRQIRHVNVQELAYHQHAIPNNAALDRLLRYEGSIERNLARSLDRLERLQRRRKGEPVLPPVSVRVTR